VHFRGWATGFREQWPWLQPANPFSRGMVAAAGVCLWAWLGFGPAVAPGEHREAPMRAWHSQPAVPMPGWQQRRPTPQTAPRGQALPRAPGDGRGLLFWSSLVNAYAKAAPLVGFTCRLQIERRTPSRWPGRSLSNNFDAVGARYSRSLHAIGF